nr:hypothetical protein [Lachnospiraceae bacterium]
GTGTGTGSGTSSTQEETVKYESISRSFSMEYTENNQVHTSTWVVNLSLIDRNTGTPIDPDSYPKSLSEGDYLPGFGDSPYSVALQIDGNTVSDYELAGWYLNSTDAEACSEQGRITQMPASSGLVPLYAGIKRVTTTPSTVTLTIVNLFPEAGSLVIPENPTDGYTYTSSSGTVTVSGISVGDEYTLPLVERLASHYDSSGYTSSPYIATGQFGTSTDLLFYSTDDSKNAAKFLLTSDENTVLTDTYINPVMLNSDLSASSVPSRDEAEAGLTITMDSDMTVYMYFGAPVTIETTSIMLKPSGSGTYKTAEEIRDENSSAWNFSDDHIPLKLKDGQAEQQQEWWALVDVEPQSQSAYLYTYYYGKELDIPEFAPPSGSGRDVLTTYMRINNINNPLQMTSVTTSFVNGSLSFEPSGGNHQRFPFTSADLSMSFTAKAVDYVVLDVSGYKSDPDFYFSIGSENPYLIRDSAGEALGRYKLAIIDCIEQNGSLNYYPSDPTTDSIGLIGGAFDTTVLDLQEDGQHFVVVPSDLMTPWETGITTSLSAPSNVYSNMTVTGKEKRPYIGRKGYKLVGFSESYTKSGGTAANPLEILGRRSSEWTGGAYKTNGSYGFMTATDIQTYETNKVGVLLSVYNAFSVDHASDHITLVPKFIFEDSMTVRTGYCEAESSDPAGYYMIFENLDTFRLNELTFGTLDSYNRLDSYALEIYCRKTGTNDSFNYSTSLGVLNYDPVESRFVLSGRGGSTPDVYYTVQADASGLIKKFKLPLYDICTQTRIDYANAFMGSNGLNIASIQELEVAVVGNSATHTDMDLPYDQYELGYNDNYFTITPVINGWNYSYSPVSSPDPWYSQSMVVALGHDPSFAISQNYDYWDLSQMLIKNGIIKANQNGVTVTSISVDSDHFENVALYYKSGGDYHEYTSSCGVTDPYLLYVGIAKEGGQGYKHWTGRARLTVTINSGQGDEEHSIWLYSATSGAVI